MRGFVLLAALAMSQAASPQVSTQLADEVGALAAQTDNDARFDALTRLLQAHQITFAVEPFTIPTPLGKEPRTRGRNVVVSLGSGADQIVIGAHYDAVRLPDGSLSHGAVDNAASCVMLVHVAEALRDKRLAGQLKILWFDMEETGLLGSAHFIEAHQGERIRAMVNFDIDAFGDTFLFAHPPGGESASFRQAFRQTCAERDEQCIAFPSLPFGDDRSFGKAHVPTLSVATLPATQVHQMWLLMNAGADGHLVPGTVPRFSKSSTRRTTFC